MTETAEMVGAVDMDSATAERDGARALGTAAAATTTAVRPLPSAASPERLPDLGRAVTPSTVCAPPDGGPGAVIARGKRVYLRTLVPDDLRHVAEWADEPFLERLVGSEFLYSFKHVYDSDASFYDACLADASQIVLVIMAYRGWSKPLGLVRLFNIHVIEGYAFLETMLTDERAIRKGFGVEAGRLISYYGVDVLGLRRIEAKVYEHNVLSANTLRRNGFHLEGVLRKAALQDGKYWDVLVFGILKEEIEQQRKKDKIFFFPTAADAAVAAAQDARGAGP